jgi:TetR/AcrR family tetracycline transcriptional repressor
MASVMSQRGSLSRERIVAQAMVMLDADGEANFSMRRLAAEMGVDPMALYHHIPNRAALMREVVDALLDECELPAPSGSWQDRVRALCHAFRRLAHRHPGAFMVYALFHEWVPSEHRLHEALYAALDAGGFAPVTMVRGGRLLIAYAETFAWEEITQWIVPYSGEDRAKLIESLAAGDYPLTTALVDQIADIDPDAEFAFGLDVVIRGLEAELGSEE